MNETKRHITTRSPDETRNLGGAIGRHISSPLIIALYGDLGSGKTAFVQGLAAGLEVPSEFYITSPTFTLINEYPGRLPLLHIDLYRLDRVDDFDDIGLDELLYERAVTAIEWAQKLTEPLPEDHLLVKFSITGDSSRDIRLIASGHPARNLIKTLEIFK